MKRTNRPADKTVSRRDAMLMGVGSVVALPFLKPHADTPRPALVEQTTGNPRFVSKEKKEKRRKNRLNEVQTTYLAQFVVRKSAKAQTLHFSSREGIVRLTSPMGPSHQLAPVTDAEATQSLAALAQREQPWLWEYAALTRIENGEMDGALAILQGGARHAMQHEPVNLRLFDLLAGLTLRTGRAIHEVDELSRTGTDSAKVDPDLERRRQLWRTTDTRWAKRWLNKDKPVKWAHPIDQTADKRQRRVPIP